MPEMFRLIPVWFQQMCHNKDPQKSQPRLKLQCSGLKSLSNSRHSTFTSFQVDTKLTDFFGRVLKREPLDAARKCPKIPLKCACKVTLFGQHNI